VTYFLGILIFMMPIAVLVGFGSKQAAMRSPRGWTWLKIACQAVLLSACLTGFIVALDVFRSGQDMLGLTLLFLPITAMGVLICAGAMVGNLVGMPPRS
jgi:CHAT domain-containing protein